MGFIISFVLLALTQIALGQAAADQAVVPPDMFVEKGFWDTILSGDFFMKMLPVVIGTQVILLGVAEGLTRISAATENKWDNKAASMLSEAAWLLGLVIGKFGYSTPKLVLEEKAKSLAEKK